jgi:hypothetical protein
MAKIDRNLLFFGNSVDSTVRLHDLEQFREYVDGFLAREAEYFKSEHVDLEIEFLPLFAETFPPILHSTIVISTAMLLEQEMRGYSTAILESIASNLKFNDLSGSVLDRFRTIVTKVAKMPLDLTGVWEDICGVFEIRNCLVHAGGELAGFSKASAIEAFVARHGTSGCSEHLQVDAAMSALVLQIASAFLNRIYDAALEAFPGDYKPLRPRST